MSIVIRQATADDLEEICALTSRSLPATAAKRKEARLRRISQPQDQEVVGFVAEENGILLGYASVDIYPDPFLREVGDLFVAQNERGRGIASNLADAQMAYLATFQGRICVGTVTSTVSSQKIYSQRGFTPTGLWLAICPNYSEEGGQDDSAVMMQQYRIPPLHPPPLLYVPPSFREITAATFHRVFEKYDPLVICDAEETIPSQKFLEKHHENPRQHRTILLHEPDAEAQITYLQNAGYYFSEFVYPLHHDTVHLAARFWRKPEAILLREHLHIIPEARAIADFVWEQYARGRR